VAICVGIFAAAPGSLRTSRLLAAVNTGETVQSNRTPSTAGDTRSPIRHLIVVVGENRSFDNVFGTYTPSDPTQRVWNLLSQGIVRGDGRPGPNFALAAQQQAADTTSYQISPSQTGPFPRLPRPSTGFGALPAAPCAVGQLLFQSNAFCSDAGIDPMWQFLLSASWVGTGQSTFVCLQGNCYYPVPDCRYSSQLPNGPFPFVGASQLNACGEPFLGQFLHEVIVPTTFFSYVGDPVHRFYQMWQQSDCSIANINPSNPSGCKQDLYAWVAVTVGYGVTDPSAGDTFQGGVAMGFYNMEQGDFPYFQWLGQHYAISDNYHQPVMGGTGPNSQFMLTGDVHYFTDSNGNPAMPAPEMIENPNPRPGTNNFYINDGFFQVDDANTGVGFTKCSDNTQPGVQPIMDYIHALPYMPFNDGNCAPGHWYQVNNDYPWYNGDGSIISEQGSNAFPCGRRCSIGPQTIPNIGDALSARHIAWRYYGGGMNTANQNPPLNKFYSVICNGFQYSTSIMTTSLRQNLVDFTQFYTDVTSNQLPSVSFVKPDNLLAGNPATSTPALFEAFVRKIVDAVRANDQLWRDTAILITFDEGGGLYDSGYIQPIDFFGDGPRTVLVAVSPFATQGYVDHTYTDHASILKFIEWNWNVPPLSSRSRDNLPNPVAAGNAPYFPLNSPAIGDLRTLFTFSEAGRSTPTPRPRPTPAPRP